MPGQLRTKVYLTFGLSEDEAIDRIWDTFKGTTFQKEYQRDGASAELVIGKILKIGG